MLVTSAAHSLSYDATKSKTTVRRVANMAEDHPRKAWNNSFSIDAIIGAAGSQHKRSRSSSSDGRVLPSALSAFHAIGPAASPPASGEP